MGKNIGWWILGLLGVGAVGYFVFRPSGVQAQRLPRPPGLPSGLVVPPGVTLDAADWALLSDSYLRRQRDLAACQADDQRCRDNLGDWLTQPDGGANGALAQYGMYLTNFNTWAQQMTAAGVDVSSVPRTLTFSAYIHRYH